MPDARRANGWVRWRALPVAIKDVLCVEGRADDLRQPDARDFRPPYDATVIARLKAADAVLIGKTNMDEFAMGSSTENSAYGPTRNPWNKTHPRRLVGRLGRGGRRRPGPAGAGHDTGGSIRQPAGFCGVVGMKPTYGRVSRYGLVAFASSLDQVGPFAHDVADAALLLEAIAGHDPRTRRASTRPVPDYMSTLERPDRPADRPGPRAFRRRARPRSRGRRPRGGPRLRGRRRVRPRGLAAALEIRRAGLLPGRPGRGSSNLARYDGTIYGHRAADFSPRYPGEEECRRWSA